MVVVYDWDGMVRATKKRKREKKKSWKFKIEFSLRNNESNERNILIDLAPAMNAILDFLVYEYEDWIDANYLRFRVEYVDAFADNILSLYPAN